MRGVYKLLQCIHRHIKHVTRVGRRAQVTMGHCITLTIEAYLTSFYGKVEQKGRIYRT